MIDLIGFISSFLTFFGLYAIWSLSLNLEFGYLGIANFGKVAFIAIGAFISGSLISYMIMFLTGSYGSILSTQAIVGRMQFVHEQPHLFLLVFITSLAVCVIVGGIFGYLTSLYTLKVKEDTLACVLLILAEILRLIVRNYTPIVGGTVGLAGVPNPFDVIGSSRIAYLGFTFLVLTVFIVILVYVEKLVNSPFGRLLRAIRDKNLVAETLGKNLRDVRSKVIFISSAIASLGGGLYVYYLGSVHPDDFRSPFTFEIWLIVYLGGIGNNKGVLLGALVMTLLDKGTRMLGFLSQSFGVLPFSIPHLRYIIMGILMVLIFAYRKSGIMPEEPVKTCRSEVLRFNEDS